MRKGFDPANVRSQLRLFTYRDKLKTLDSEL